MDFVCLARGIGLLCTFSAKSVYGIIRNRCSTLFTTINTSLSLYLSLLWTSLYSLELGKFITFLLNSSSVFSPQFTNILNNLAQELVCSASFTHLF